ncbi:hypothetical protein [Acidovorax sp. FG27]|uniref:hypothetical protein n=1 Tax=Acidovorax sp. FG27 TaxID=3133652 RepID=UPI0030E98342
MFDRSTAAALHRALPEPGPSRPAGSPFVVLPVRLPTTDALACRRTLHHLLGRRLASYCMRVDTPHGALCVDLNVRPADVAHCMRLLVAGLPRAEFGHVGAVRPPARPEARP